MGKQLSKGGFRSERTRQARGLQGRIDVSSFIEQLQVSLGGELPEGQINRLRSNAEVNCIRLEADDTATALTPRYKQVAVRTHPALKDFLDLVIFAPRYFCCW